MPFNLMPGRIDSTPQLFLWEIDEFIVLALVLVLGVLVGGIYNARRFFITFKSKK